ncbi:hypothetical protein LXT21_38855 [Myxococcus sp. K38C18041901]|uniref:hypothetical protein n=1 Tax=Myxococcus guangdongensis TaxID=2906760 RepID=UPI0020A7137C|nr:hypothetical protein [Myxococcus guangdongensis]MCP3064749.1 hypothetical protein [Myxococcus guangdongensis]
MSQHDIEDLVEESAQAVLDSARDDAQKRKLIGALYAWQAQYDTGDTFGRLAEGLKTLGFDPERDVQDLPLLQLADTMMTDAAGLGRRQLVHHWLSALTDAIDEDLVSLSELGGTFEAFIQREDAQRVRRLSLEHDVHGFKSRGAYRRLQRWADIRHHYQTLEARYVERKYILRWLMDLKLEPEKVVDAYHAEKAKLARLDASPIHALPTRVSKRGPFAFVSAHQDDAKRFFTFAVGERPAQPDATRLYLELEHNQELNILVATLYAESGLLRRWKGLSTEDGRPDLQFRFNFFLLVPEDQVQSDKALHDYGGWKYKLDQSQKLLEQRLDSLFSYWPLTRKWADFHAVPVAERLAQGDLATLEQQRKEHRDAYGWFVNDVELMFAYASAEWERGTTPTATLATLAARLPYVVDRYPMKGEWVEGLEKLREGPYYPPTPTRLPYRAVDPEEESDGR